MVFRNPGGMRAERRIPQVSACPGLQRLPLAAVESNGGESSDGQRETRFQVLGFLFAFVGLAFMLPILAHANWHLYRKVVQ
jgi:hypothetical protein